MKTAKHNHPLKGLDEDTALRHILSGTAGETGERFFVALVENLAEAVSTHVAWVTEYLRESDSLRALAFLVGDQLDTEYEYKIAGTPCEPVILGAKLVHHPDNVQASYPNDADLRKLQARSYLGVPLLDTDATVLGHMAVIDTQPMPKEPKGLAVFQIFASRAAAELQRLRAEREVEEREEKLGLLVGSAMDAIIELDSDLKIIMINAATENTFGIDSDVVGRSFADFLTQPSKCKLTKLMREVDAQRVGQSYLWIPKGLDAIAADSMVFPAEATLSRFEAQGTPHYTLILRDINERLKADKQIRSLTVEAEYLREEINAFHNFKDIVGRSEPLLQVLRDLEQVAPTDATVLVLGETGTGKELVARALHAASKRKDKPLIKVDCAALPASLIESEFFGHEKGAFTGATKKREGRFALADQGTIFLDEIGELPIELQVKLLRVLQEGEFEPVGSSRTIRVDVRVIAATNRDLFEATQNGEFREDLYYRLAVFPLQIPPLRTRQDDIPCLAMEFAKRYGQRIGRETKVLHDRDMQRLLEYSWPGNVRELQNVVERALITSQDGYLNLDRALPETTVSQDQRAEPTEDRRIRTADELKELERQNLMRALDAAGWRVAGRNGAAELLGMNPTTLSSRIKALGMRRPD